MNWYFQKFLFIFSTNPLKPYLWDTNSLQLSLT